MSVRKLLTALIQRAHVQRGLIALIRGTPFFALRRMDMSQSK